MAEIKRYYPNDITNRKTAQEALNLSITQINQIQNNLDKFKYYESQSEDYNTYHYVMQRLNQIKENIENLKDYYQKTNKAFFTNFNNLNKVAKPGFVCFNEGNE